MAAKAICTVVLTFDTISGRISIGLSMSHDTITPPMIITSRDTTRMASVGGIACEMPSAT